jgi:hypothetical protein
MNFGVSDIARLFEVDKNLVKTWAYHFAEYLAPAANPAKGLSREFSAEDLRVLAYVFMYWEDEPDYETIKIGLNTNSHFEEQCNNFLSENTPLFREPPDELDESWRHGTIFGGMADDGDFFTLAESYKLAGDILVNAALSSDDVYSLICPAIYNYRHATELYLKATLANPKQHHDLTGLFREFKDTLKAEFAVDSTPPKWFENVIVAFDDFDPKSTTFRYGGLVGDELWIDLPHVKTQMSWLAESFLKIRQVRGHL